MLAPGFAAAGFALIGLAVLVVIVVVASDQGVETAVRERKVELAPEPRVGVNAVVLVVVELGLDVAIGGVAFGDGAFVAEQSVEPERGAAHAPSQSFL